MMGTPTSKVKRRGGRRPSSDPDVQRQEQAAGLPCDRVAEIDANVLTRIERDEPAIRKADVQGRAKLQIADVPPGRVAYHADVVAKDRLEIARLADLRQCDAETHDRHHPPLSRAQGIGAGRCDQARAEADRPAGIDVVNDCSLDIGITNAVQVIAVGIARVDRVPGQQGKIRPRHDGQGRRQIEGVIVAKIERLGRDIARGPGCRPIFILELKQVRRRPEEIETVVVGCCRRRRL